MRGLFDWHGGASRDRHFERALGGQGTRSAGVGRNGARSGRFAGARSLDMTGGDVGAVAWVMEEALLTVVHGVRGFHAGSGGCHRSAHSSEAEVRAVRAELRVFGQGGF